MRRGGTSQGVRAPIRTRAILKSTGLQSDSNAWGPGGGKWWAMRDSNPRLPVCETTGLHGEGVSAKVRLRLVRRTTFEAGITNESQPTRIGPRPDRAAVGTRALGSLNVECPAAQDAVCGISLINETTAYVTDQLPGSHAIPRPRQATGAPGPPRLPVSRPFRRAWPPSERGASCRVSSPEGHPSVSGRLR